MYHKSSNSKSNGNNSRNSSDFSQLSKRGIENVCSQQEWRENHTTPQGSYRSQQQGRQGFTFLLRLRQFTLQFYFHKLLSLACFTWEASFTWVSNRALLTFRGRWMRLYLCGMKKHPSTTRYRRLHSYQWPKSKWPKMVFFKNKWQNLLPDLSCTPDKINFSLVVIGYFKFISYW